MEDAEVLEQLKLKSSCAYRELYKAYYPAIAKYILSNNGTREDAEDIFQEALMILTRNIDGENFILSSSIKTYLYSVSRNLWLKQLRRDKPIRKDYPFEAELLEIKDDSPEEKEHQKSVSDFVGQLISKIPYHCQKIVDFVFYKNASSAKLSEELGYNNPHTLSNIKYKCIQQMKKISGRSSI